MLHDSSFFINRITPVPRNDTTLIGTQKRTIEFAGYSEALAGPECKTCDTGFFQRGNTCPANMAIENRDRVCVYDPILLEDKCNFTSIILIVKATKVKL